MKFSIQLNSSLLAIYTSRKYSIYSRRKKRKEEPVFIMKSLFHSSSCILSTHSPLSSPFHYPFPHLSPLSPHQTTTQLKNQESNYAHPSTICIPFPTHPFIIEVIKSISSSSLQSFPFPFAKKKKLHAIKSPFPFHSIKQNQPAKGEKGKKRVIEQKVCNDEKRREEEKANTAIRQPSQFCSYPDHDHQPRENHSCLSYVKVFIR